MRETRNYSQRRRETQNKKRSEGGKWRGNKKNGRREGKGNHTINKPRMQVLIAASEGKRTYLNARIKGNLDVRGIFTLI